MFILKKDEIFKIIPENLDNNKKNELANLYNIDISSLKFFNIPSDIEFWILEQNNRSINITYSDSGILSIIKVESTQNNIIEIDNPVILQES